MPKPSLAVAKAMSKEGGFSQSVFAGLLVCVIATFGLQGSASANLTKIVCEPISEAQADEILRKVGRFVAVGRKIYRARDGFVFSAVKMAHYCSLLLLEGEKSVLLELSGKGNESYRILIDISEDALQSKTMKDSLIEDVSPADGDVHFVRNSDTEFVRIVHIPN
jgi:hypothetical protein